MALGPVSYTVVAFPGNQFNGDIAPEIGKLDCDGTVRILDLVFVAKDEEGDTISLEFDQLDELAAFGDIDGEVGGLVNMEDLDHVAADLPEGNSALVIVWEDVWARPLVEAIRGSGGVRRRAGPHSGRRWSRRRWTSWPRRSELSCRGTERDRERRRSTTMPMMRRRPVMRTVGRTAVIAGTATAVAGGVNRHQQNKYAQQDAAGPAGGSAGAGGRPAAAPADDSDELINKLKELASLKDQGILTEAEFNDQKAKILAQMS